MFKALSRPLPDLKDWRFSVDQWGIGWAEFDREGESQNSLGRRPFEELAQIVAKVEEGARDKTIRGLVIISGKERGFIVGADIREFADIKTETEVIEKLRPVTALFDRIERLPVPVVCAINGFCLGGGLELALACHYRIATRDSGTKLGFPEVKLGIFPGFNGTARSIRQAGAPAAMQAMLTGIDAVGFGGARHRPRRSARRQPRRASLGGAQGGACAIASRSRPGFVKQLLTKWPARDLLARRMRAGGGQEGARGSLSRALPAHRSFRALRRQRRGDEGRRDARLRAADGLRPVAQPAPRVLAVGAAERPGAEEAQLASAARARHRRRHHGRRHRRLVRRLRHGGDAAGRLGRADRQGHRGAGQAVCAQVQDQGAARCGQGAPHRRSQRRRYRPRRRRHRGDRREPRDQAEGSGRRREAR